MLLDVLCRLFHQERGLSELDVILARVMLEVGATEDDGLVRFLILK